MKLISPKKALNIGFEDVTWLSKKKMISIHNGISFSHSFLLSARLKLKSSYIKTFIHLQSESFVQSALRFPPLVSITSDRLKLAFSFERHAMLCYPAILDKKKGHCKVKCNRIVLDTHKMIIFNFLNIGIFIKSRKCFNVTVQFCFTLPYTAVLDY